MPVPTAFQTAARIIRMAYKDAGYLQDGDEPNSEQYAEGLMRLNDLTALWQTQGVKLFLQQEVPVTLVEGTAAYSFGPAGSVVMTKPSRVLQVLHGPTSALATLTPFTREDFPRTTDKGAVYGYWVDSQIAALTITFVNPPSSTAVGYTTNVLFRMPATVHMSLNDTISFPAEWAIALRWGLADDLAIGQPVTIMQRCEQRAVAYRKALEDWDVDMVPLRFAVDVRNG